MNRGDIVICALAGDYGKPRPAVVVQSDLFNPTHASVVICPVTSHIVDAPLFRILIPAGGKTGLSVKSQAMVDKLTAIKADRIKQRIGALNPKQKSEMDSALKLWLGL
ncbi:type II toxin-antitoxin system PemK/MazF family toxin [Mariprofundus sp. NF]|uniref:type II toxin-antitoxin system PemK/MazF family toxin n=1 Tax=Mariprofundus sp. NF TaxID=2608716 RepID=UPI0015A12278|nr:type II toxin-antitoxin system PemK/MazF family toxin [Mariprofundus sp. NF]